MAAATMAEHYSSIESQVCEGFARDGCIGILGIGGGGGFLEYLRFFGGGPPSLVARRGRVLSGRAVMCVDS